MKITWLASGFELSEQECDDSGIGFKAAIDDLDVQLPQIKESFACQSDDTVRISNKTPNIHTLLANFQREHYHTEDEIRIIKEGSAIFDIRSKDDRWIRVEVEQNDLIQIPALRYHRFYATGLNQTGDPIEAIRLFKTTEGWTPVYRKDTE